MKKIFILFTLAFLAIGITACSSDDNTVEIENTKDLFLKIDRSRIKVNETVSFTAIDSDSKPVDAVFFINGLKVGKKHKFEKRGIYVVTAKKAGYKISSPLAVQVLAEGEIVTKTLELTASKYEVLTGETIDFKVTDGNNIVEGVPIVNAETSETLDQNWTPNIPGVYKIKSFGNGYLESNVITIVVKQKTVDAKKNFTIEGGKFNINKVELAVKTTATYEPILFYEDVDGKRVSFYIFTIFYSETNQEFLSYSMKVIIPEGTTKLLLPFNVDKSKVVPMDITTVIDAFKVDTIDASEFATNILEWGRPFVENEKPGTLKARLITKDGKNGVEFEGEYQGLFGDVFVEENPILEISVPKNNLKINRR